MKPGRHGAALRSLQGILAAALAVVAMICVAGHAARGGSGDEVGQRTVSTPRTTANQRLGPVVAPDQSTLPCTKKAMVEPSAKRADHSAPHPGLDHGAAVTPALSSPGAALPARTLPTGPAPPPPADMLCVLRI